MSESSSPQNLSKRNVAFIGLGVMGFPMAGHLANAGQTVRVHNRTASKMGSWLDDYNGTAEPSVAEVVEGADVVITCLGDDTDLRAVVFGETGVLSNIKQGAVLIDHTTASAEIAREMNEQAQARGATFLDAPLSGGQFGAEKGALTILLGGEEETFQNVEPIMQAYAKELYLMGPAGMGQITKMINQIFIAGIFQSLSEGLNFAMRSGVEINHAIDVLSKCTGHSWQMDHRAENMVNGKFDYGFVVNLIHKDLQLCLQEAENIGADLPITSQIDDRYVKLVDQGLGKMDATSLIKLLQAEGQ
jgi:3-hydroxyisobutyrate dehydrogenase-like beta-hydroxyacid dehydrogenase